MQHNKDPWADETYLTWQDLLDEEEDGGHSAVPGTPGTENPALLYGAPARESAESPLALPPDVQTLMAEKERLEGEMAHLTGQGPPRPEEERMRRMYPVRVHTKESRIEDRRLRRHDEQQRMLKQRALEKKLVQARERERQEVAAAQRKRRALEAALAKVRADESAAEAEQRRRQRAAKAAAAVARAARRQEERTTELERQEIEQALVQARWAGDREKALRRRALDRHAERVRQVDDLDGRRTLSKATAAVEKPLHSGEPSAERNEPLQAPAGAARRAAQAWEEEREWQREQALARLRAARAEAANLDRRGKKRNRFEAAER
jgi:hypothetical protein